MKTQNLTSTLSLLVLCLFICAACTDDKQSVSYKPIEIIFTSDAPSFGDNKIVNLYVDNRLVGTITKSLPSMSQPTLDFLKDGIHPEPGSGIVYTIKKEKVNVRFEVIPSDYPA